MATDINRTTSIALPGEVSSEILQKTQESSAVMSLAQPIKLPGLGVTIPVITGDPEAAWVAETAKKPVKRGTLDTKIMQPYTLAVLQPVPPRCARTVQAAGEPSAAGSGTEIRRYCVRRRHRARFQL